MPPASVNFLGENDWSLENRDASRESDLARKLSIFPLTAHLLLQRNIETTTEAERFLYPSWDHLPDFKGLPDLDRALTRFVKALEKREKILFYGDYDVDGITGTAELVSFFRELGLKTSFHLPHRIHEGYGLNVESLKKILQKNRPDLIVTIDNGTNATESIRFLKGQGIDLIVIDHHETPKENPPIVALLNPKRKDASFPKELASAGLVYLILLALRAELRSRGVAPLPNLRRYLDLACLGTIADMVPLTGINRLLVKEGLQEIEQTQRPGLKALMHQAQVRFPVGVSAVSFRIAPRLNAAGRLSHAGEALELLLAQTVQEGIVLAGHLENLNQQRQQIERQIVEEAFEIVHKEQKERKGLVVYKTGWHLGVVGIVASKLVEEFKKPSVVLAIENGIAKGSARTLDEISIYDALSSLSSSLITFGGHHAAAGLSLKAEGLADFSHRFDQSIQNIVGDSKKSALLIDAQLALSEIQNPLLKELDLLTPHGPGNRQPIFTSPEVQFSNCRIVGQKHLKTTLVHNKASLDGIFFDWGQSQKKLPTETPQRIAFYPQINSWNGTESIQLVVRHILAEARN